MMTRTALLVLALGTGCSEYNLNSRTDKNLGVDDDDTDDTTTGEIGRAHV